MQRQQLSRTLSSSDESLSRVLIQSAEQTSEHTLPLSIVPSSSSVVTTTRRTIQTQTVQEIQTSFPSKSIPSFAETQLLSVYYPSQNPKTSSTNDKCIFVEQQDRQPIRYRTTYDPLSSTKSTQTSPTSPPLSTHGSTLIIDGNDENNSKYDQYLKIHSGSQHLSTNFNDDSSLSNELIEESKYSYEEYIVNLQKNPIRTPSASSSSSVTTVIEQNDEIDSDQTSHLTFDEINTTQSSTSSTLTNQEKSSNQRISSWPPVPDDILLNENDEQKRPSRVQFAEQLVHVIPVSTTNSLTEEQSRSPPPIIPRKNINDMDSRHPINQSKWIKTHMDSSDIPTISTTSSRVETLRSLFEQQSSSINQNRRIEPEEKPSKHGVEIRFRVNDPNTSSIYHAEPATVIQHTEKSSDSISPFNLDQIQQITGKQIKNLDEIGHYLHDGYTWQWNEIFWLSLTTSQRDQLKELEQKLYSRQNSFDNDSSNDTKRFKTTINITGAGSWQQNKPQISTSGITKYTEINSVDETQTSVTVFSSAPRINSQESIPSLINQNKRTDSMSTVVESGYNSSDDQQKFRPNSSTIIEESLHHIDSSKQQPKLDPLSYEQFIIDYLSTHAKNLRSNNGTLILVIDGQQIHMSNVSLPSSNENLILAKNIYLDAINHDLLPFETELDQLVIIICGEAIILPSDRWLFYRKKYNNAKWIEKLKRINRNIPSQLIPFIEQWLSDHATIELDTQKLNVDGLMIPLIGRLGLHLLDLYKIQQLQTNYWSELLKYLIRIGYVSYDSNQKLVHIANSELDVQRVLKSPLPTESLPDKNNQTLKSINEDHIQLLTKWLEQLNQQKLINITEKNDIIIYPSDHEKQIFIKYEHIDEYMETKSNSKQTDIIKMNDLAHILILYNYVQYSSGKLTYRNQNIQLDTSEFLWLQSIIHSIRIIESKQQTEIELFDGQHTQVLQIPYEYMSPTNNKRIITNYLFQNGNIRYDANEGHYAYRYVSPNEETHPVKHTNQHELLSSHIRQIHIDKINQQIEIEFSHDPNHFLQLPSNWYQDILKHDFNRSYIIDMLLNNGGIINEDNFIFNNHSYSLKFSSKQKENLIDYYVEFINNHDGIKYDNNTNLLLLENPLDGSELYLTSEHTEFIHKNQYRRQDMKYLLNKYSEIKQDEFNNWLLYYNNQCIQIPTKNQINEQVQINHSEFPNRSHKTIDPKLKLLFPFNKSLRLIQKTPSTTTLDIQQDNNYTIHPLLILSNYIYRAATIYQDERGRLVIKLNQDEIVIPRIQAIHSIQAINTSPNRTGTIIARLIDSIGKVQSNNAGGIIITIGKSSLELSKDILDQSKNNLNLSNENLASHSKSSSTITKSESADDLRTSRSQTSLCLKPRLLIMYSDENDDTTRFYIQYKYEYDRKSNTVMMLPSRYPVRPTQPQLIAPQHYRDIALRDASVYVYKQGENEVYYENLAQYLSTKQTDLSSYTVRRMLKFTSRDEYFAYLNKQMSANNAEQLVQESEEPISEILSDFTNIRIRTSDRELNRIEDNNQKRSRSPTGSYNVQDGRSPQTVHSHHLTTPEKNITLPRSTASGHSNDGESESRATVSRSASAAAKVATSKSDTMKSTTSSSAGSSREHPVVSSSATVVRTQSLVSPNRTSGSKGGGEEIKKEKKSKFRTPSFLRKRKEKKEAAAKEKAEKEKAEK